MRFFIAFWLSGCLAVSATSSFAQKPPPPPGEIVGTIELAPNVPCSNCMVVVEGSPFGARADGAGSFDIQRLAPGRWDLRITAPGLPDHRIAAGANSGQVTNLGILRPWPPGSISGRVELPASSMLADTLIEVPIQGLTVRPGADGTFLLTGVAPGPREVLVSTAQRRLHKKVVVTVQSGQTTRTTVKITDIASSVVKPSSTVPVDRAQKLPAQTPPIR